MPTRPSAREIFDFLQLQPHPVEGGAFVETYRHPRTLPVNALPSGYRGPRSISTAIFYLLTPGTFSELHRLPSDEIFHFYLGDPVEMLQLYPDGRGVTIILGADLLAGQRPQVVVPGGVWQGSRLVGGGEYALMGCTVAPGFDYADYERGTREELLGRYPDFHELILQLSHPENAALS